MKKIFWLPVILILATCGIVPLTGRKQLTAIPSSQMISLATSSYQNVLKEEKISKNERYRKMVTDVGNKISFAVENYMRENGLAERIANYDWQYVVLESDQVNAWCLPGGKIAFYEGIMPICQDENGVAVVMAHEIAHAVARHGNERLSQQLTIQLGGIALTEALKKEKETTQQLAMLAFGVGSQVGVMLPYSRLHEKEADELGLYYMAMAGFDPHGAIEFWKRMNERDGQRPPEFLSTHPHPGSRISNLNQYMDEAMKYYKK